MASALSPPGYAWAHTPLCTNVVWSHAEKGHKGSNNK